MALREEILSIGHAGVMILNDGNSINYGVIRIQDNNLIHFNGKGLQNM